MVDPWTLEEFYEKADSEGGWRSMWRWGGELREETPVELQVLWDRYHALMLKVEQIENQMTTIAEEDG